MVAAESVRTVVGQRIDVLYKLYPTEQLLLDEAPDGTPVGLLLMDLVRKRRLAVINPPIAFILQNKALLALLWALHCTNSPLFSAQEHRWIDRYLLPTTLDPFDEQGCCVFADQYVVKPIYGREGRSITIRLGEAVVEQSKEAPYNDQKMIYQQYVDLPTTRIQTEDGPTIVNLVHNCFIAGGIASAVGVRASRQRIFDDSAYFLPVCYAPEKRHRQRA